MNWRRLKEPPRTSETVLTVSVLARPGTPSSRTWPPASSATITRSSIASWPTITRLISNSAVSSASCASRAGLRSRRSSSSSARRRLSSRAHAAVSSVERRHPCCASFGRVPSVTLERLTAPVALHHDLHGIAGLAREHGLAEIRRGRDRAVRRSGRIRSPCRRPPFWAGAPVTCWTTRAVARGRVGGGDAEPGAVDLAVGLQLRDDLLDRVDRDGEAHPGVRVGAVGGDLGVDPDHAAVRRRAAGRPSCRG